MVLFCINEVAQIGLADVVHHDMTSASLFVNVAGVVSHQIVVFEFGSEAEDPLGVRCAFLINLKNFHSEEGTIGNFVAFLDDGVSALSYKLADFVVVFEPSRSSSGRR